MRIYTRTALVLLGLTVVTGLTGCTHPDPGPTPAPAPAYPQSVALAVSAGMPQPVRIGLVVPPVEGEGSPYRLMTEGAGIAVYRFALSGAHVELVTVLDDGTADGAANAMRSLVSEGVAGVVMASTGGHTSTALTVAAAAGVPVVMTYGQPPTPVDGVWSLAPTRSQVTAALRTTLRDAGASRPALVSTGENPLDVPAVTRFSPDDPAGVAAAVLTQVEALFVDSVIIDAPADTQARLVSALQTGLADRQIPILLTPEALTPVFAQTLASTGTVASGLTTVGVDTGDLASLGRGGRADAAAGFFAALRLAANDPACRNIYHDDTCAAGTAYADITSHDAVVVLVRAAEHAASTDPSAVRTALGTLQLTAADGLAGPPLDFTAPTLVANDTVVALYSTTTNPGVRPPTSDTPCLYWFAGTP
ncbi:MAG: ABC transporter substrate-binding protein [Propionibacteriaceae bacterium]|nr:ABC transporter substrate-binding protein [Propionibacteriaceae bacterium]